MNFKNIHNTLYRFSAFDSQRFGAVAALLLMLTLSACPSKSGPGKGDPGNRIDQALTLADARNTLVVAPHQLQMTRSFKRSAIYTGVVEAARQSALGFELGGTVKEILVDEGDSVHTGQVLAKLDSDRIAARVAQAQAGLQQAQTQQILAASTLVRMQDAASFDGVSTQQFDEAQNAARAADAAVDAAEARLSSVQVDAAKAVLMAPYNAWIQTRHIDEGQVVSPGQALFNIQDKAPPRVRVGIAGDRAQTLKPKEQVNLQINEKSYKAKVKSVSVVRDRVTRTVDVVFDFVDSNIEAVRPGDLATLTLSKNIEAPGFWIPLSALTEGQRGLWNVYWLTNQTKVRNGAQNRIQNNNPTFEIEARAVEILYQDGRQAFVNGAVSDGDLIVSAGLNRIVPGQHVRLSTSQASPSKQGLVE